MSGRRLASLEAGLTLLVGRNRVDGGRSAYRSCLFPLAINGRIRTGTDKGNPTV